MKVVSVYIFRKDGIPLFSTFYDPQIRTVDALATPFFTSISNRLEEMTGKSMKQISLSEDYKMIMEEFEEIYAILVYQGKDDLSFQLNIVARRFYKKYHQSIMGKHWKGQLEYFDDFIPILEDILEIENNISYAQIPSKPLDTFILADYSNDTQGVIKQLIQKKEILKEDIVKLNNDLVTSDLANLIDDGYIGRKFVDEIEYYFIQS